VYTVPVEINGLLTLPFILDTGATDVNMPADVVLTLLRTGTIQDPEDFLPGATYTFADGTQTRSPRFMLRSLQLGHRLITQVPARLGTVESPLLLGQSFLNRLGVWSLDTQREVLILGPLPPPNLPQGPQGPSMETAPSPKPFPAADKWFVICGTFAEHEMAQAQQRRALLLAQGYAHTFLASSTGYPTFQPGYLVVMLGPFSKGQAEETHRRARAIVADAYIKAGW
jgi:hypothetical protein